ncbi:MAG: hypothetical protein J6W29_01480 [Neisseriaceae bacterium]|nr:hypothetical protein [Neisseriaceae bacterium]
MFRSLSLFITAMIFMTSSVSFADDLENDVNVLCTKFGATSVAYAQHLFAAKDKSEFKQLRAKMEKELLADGYHKVTIEKLFSPKLDSIEKDIGKAFDMGSYEQRMQFLNSPAFQMQGSETMIRDRQECLDFHQPLLEQNKGKK